MSIYKALEQLRSSVLWFSLLAMAACTLYDLMDATNVAIDVYVINAGILRSLQTDFDNACNLSVVDAGKIIIYAQGRMTYDSVHNAHAWLHERLDPICTEGETSALYAVNPMSMADQSRFGLDVPDTFVTPIVTAEIVHWFTTGVTSDSVINTLGKDVVSIVLSLLYALWIWSALVAIRVSFKLVDSLYRVAKLHTYGRQ